VTPNHISTPPFLRKTVRSFSFPPFFGSTHRLYPLESCLSPKVMFFIHPRITALSVLEASGALPIPSVTSSNTSDTHPHGLPHATYFYIAFSFPCVPLFPPPTEVLSYGGNCICRDAPCQPLIVPQIMPSLSHLAPSPPFTQARVRLVPLRSSPSSSLGKEIGPPFFLEPSTPPGSQLTLPFGFGVQRFPVAAKGIAA